MKIKLENGAVMPHRAHPEDAGLDLYSRESKVVPAHGSAFFDTGVHMELPPRTVGFVKSRSGLMSKYDIITDGVIDESYTGSIGVKLFNLGQFDYFVTAGDRIAQLVITPVVKPYTVPVDELERTVRSESGFGSTGR